MKHIITLLIVVCFSPTSFAQNGINYKALIKDANGNFLASSPINIQFIIYEGAALTNSVYQETHTINTDAYGFAIVNIGEGTTGNDFSLIEWSEDEHFLNVQINTGSGLVDLGTTQFMHVPYAISAETAKNVKGLEPINEGNGIGYRIIGRDTTNYGNIGENAIDLSYSFSNANDYGALGKESFAVGKFATASEVGAVAIGRSANAIGFNSLAMGNSATASGASCIAIGRLTNASGLNTVAIGEFSRAIGITSYAIGFDAKAEFDEAISLGIRSLASGYKSVAIGHETISPSYAETAIGNFNANYAPNGISSWDQNDRLFAVGNGTSDSNRSNALTILKSGNIGIGTENPQELLHLNGTLRIGDETIRDAGNDALRINAALIPDFDDTNVLGNSSQRWRTVYAVNGTINTSDRREKKNINNLHYGLAEVLQMQPVSFNWKSKNNPDLKLGLIAQELQELIPEVVQSHSWEIDEISGQLTKKELERLGVYYSDLVPVLIKAIQEQNAIIKNQGDALEASHKNYEALLSRIERLEIKSSN